MIEENIICPYTGLRPFTEEESIYFKGRDEHIDQATRQLEKNKFIMLTGASGDGKSSLVYAGILPNAKAGFLKSQYSNWAVADFRPERNPLGNLSHALALQLGISSERTIRTELGHGFSALVELYKASPLYIDVKETDWVAMDEKQKSTRKRASANLVIIADQYEEFFTNPENFQKGIPSQEANLVTNLLLETSRIALEENLPIYVIITMRSDFIGQCACFRGLPEAIGFSQFFVPRLNRTQLQEVIEEPARLSGNRISRRLTERLIHDMVEGTDQLPILQHALNQIWKMADEGRSEMDLLHYAMVGGMGGRDLPAEDTKHFELWFNQLLAKIQACYTQPDLQNVLNTHANKLYSFASDYLKDQYQENIDEEDARIIIETTFKCLTKIDNSRAVRNRMTLGEISAIINLSHVDFIKVGKVLNIFREPGNTLLRPFLEEVPELKENSVLDITHESLIRNWVSLDQWAKEEFGNCTTFQDFSQQLNRWLDSGKSNSFLLYIGPLTYFENFFKKAKPSVGWIARYLGEELDHKQKYARAGVILENALEFLKRSARKHVATRTVMRYGAKKIAVVLLLASFILFSSFVLKTWLDRRNPAVLGIIKEKGLTIINNPKILFSDRALFAIEIIRLKLSGITEIVTDIADPIQQLEIANGISGELVILGRTQPAKEIIEALTLTDSLLGKFQVNYQNSSQLSDLLKNVNEWRAVLGIAWYYHPSEKWMQFQTRNAERSAEFILNILDRKPSGFTDMLNFSLALETALNFNALDSKELNHIIHELSPFENSQRSEWINNHFKADQILIRGYQGYGFNFNGLYQELACLYAAEGNVERSLQSIDTLLKYNEPYYQRDYTNLLDNATNVASEFYRNRQTSALDAFVAGYCERKKQSEIEFYYRLLGRMQPYQLTRNSHFLGFWDESQNLNLQYGDEKEVSFFYKKFREAIHKSTNADERNFMMAIAHKNEGLILAHHAEVSGKPYNQDTVFRHFKRSMEYYRNVKESYLNEIIDRTGVANADIIPSPRKDIFIFPDVVFPFAPLGARDYHWNYLSASFIDFLITQNLFDSLYTDTKLLKHIEGWLSDYSMHVFAGENFIRQHADPGVLKKLETELSRMKVQSKIDLNFLYLFLGYYAFGKGDQELAMKYYTQVKTENLGNILRNKILTGYSNGNPFFLVANGFQCFLKNKRMDEAGHLLNFFKRPANRSSVYAFTAMSLSDENPFDSLIRPMLDSAQAEMLRVDNLNSPQPNRIRLATAVVATNPTEHSIQFAKRMIKNQQFKFTGLQRIARAMGKRHQIFNATQLIPDNISDTDQLTFFWNILFGYDSGLPQATDWNEFQKNTPWLLRTNFLFYVDESN